MSEDAGGELHENTRDQREKRDPFDRAGQVRDHGLSEQLRHHRPQLGQNER